CWSEFEIQHVTAKSVLGHFGPIEFDRLQSWGIYIVLLHERRKLTMDSLHPFEPPVCEEQSV
ncbi:MAG TPA: hypothetical protein VGR36_00560, partial [Candidatus Acidoferrales bacterium]|nr:hypothetical protein [Candidatus Acidoferrales bacterium]